MHKNKLKAIIFMTLIPIFMASPMGNANPQAQHLSTVAPTPAPQDLMMSSSPSSLTEHPDVENQVKGQYPDLERKESLPLGAIQHAWDYAKEGAGVYNVTYTGGEIIKLRCREMMTTCIILPTWERVDKFTLGDPSSFKVEQPRANIITIQPQEFTGLDSNLVVIGVSGKVYSFYLRSEGYNTNHVPDLAVYIRVAKPSTLSPSLAPIKGKEEFTKDDYLEEVSFNPSNLNFNFTMAGDKEIAPHRVYSDGIRTWFDYGEEIKKKGLPAIYAVIDGVDTPINVSREGTKIVAQHSGSFTLRNGHKVVCVFPTSQEAAE
ncbi:MAG: TrbG/VirB9 family P-type conjugative transfer protein [Holosporales bacterium]|nr:TrbG/VirB9 family P-type conjugative transfer protein [Holosporales bacterium]